MKKFSVFIFTALSLIGGSGCHTEAITKTRQIGEACNDIDQCLAGLYCENRVCRKLCASKEECPPNYSCENSRCVLDSSQGVTENLCGNGRQDTGELCDDGNNFNGDGCSAKCNLETNYACHDWPSICTCAPGYQDSNSDHHCQPDCHGCGENQFCQYMPDGTARGCVCNPGYQDSNSDGNCLPDCQGCDPSQVCLYNEDGTAMGCFCPEGTQDYDGDGVCSRKCGTPKEENCGKNSRCDDSSGTAACRCVFLVKKDDFGTIWNSQALSLTDALESALTASDGGTDCELWLEEGEFALYQAYKMKNLQLYGGFRNGNITKHDRGDNNRSILHKNYDDSYMDISSAFNIEQGRAVFDGVQFSSFYYAQGPVTGQTWAGSVIMARWSDIEINNVIFYNNNTYNIDTKYGGRGGAVYLYDSRLTIKNSAFQNNIAGNGGAIAAEENSVLDIDTVTLTDNQASNSTGGGAIYLLNSTGNIKNSKFLDNYSYSDTNPCYGGAINSKNSHLTLDNNYFRNNSTNGFDNLAAGGAIYLERGSAKITGTTFTDNAATSILGDILGGTIMNDGSTDMLIDSSIITASSVYSQYSTQNEDEPRCKIFAGSAIAQHNGSFQGKSLLLADNWAHAKVCTYRDFTNQGLENGAVIYNYTTEGQAVRPSKLTDSIIFHSSNTFGQEMGVIPADGAEDWHNMDVENCSLPYNLRYINDNEDYLTNNCRLGAELPNYQLDHFKRAVWISEDDSSQTGTTKLEADQTLWHENELVGKYVRYQNYNNSFYFHLPIIANGENYVVVDGGITNGNYHYLLPFYYLPDHSMNESFIMPGNQEITIHDLQDLHCKL